MKTLVIHCFDPRAAEIPQKVAEYFGDEVYPEKISSTKPAIALATPARYLPRQTPAAAPPPLCYP